MSDFICEKGRTYLKKGAIPLHFLPRNAKFVTEAEDLVPPPIKKPRYNLETELQSTSQIQGDTSCSGFASKKGYISSSDSAGLKGSPKRNKRLIKKIHTYHTTEDLVRQKLNEEKHNIGILRYEKKKQVQKNKRLRKKVNHLQGIVSVIKRRNMLSPDACALLEKRFSGIPLAVMKRMLANSGKRKLIRKKYDKMIRSFAMTLHFYSSKAYEYVRKTFNLALPFQRVIRGWFSNITCEPGFSQPAFDSLKMKVSQNNSKGYATLCSLMLDEMSIKKYIDFHNGKSWGYVNLETNLNEDDSTQYATEVLVLMVVALNGDWKLPIAYFLIHSLTAEEKANLVLEALIKLDESGVIITSLTCDGPNFNFSMMNHLGANVNDLSAYKPFFLHPVNGAKIFVVFDACHMVKIMRNNWVTLGKFLDPDGEVVDFSYVKMLQFRRKKVMRLGTKLKTAHMQWTKQKIKVNLAVQMLSESVASALEFLMVDIKDPCFREAAATIKFIRVIDRVFDLLNSRNPMTVGMKMPLRKNNEDLWQPIFEEAVNYFLNCKQLYGIKLVNTTKKTPIKGFIITISSIIGIYENYVKADDAKFNFVLTYKFSQDHLELFFCTVRSRNGWNNNPSAMQFYYTYKRLLLHHDIKNMNGNCIAQDATNVLYTTSSVKTEIPLEINDIHVIKKYGMEVQENILMDHDYVMPITPSLSDISENVVAYVAGYAVKMTEKLLKCPTCIGALHQMDIRDRHLSLLLRKKWGNLIVPSNDVIKVCREVEITLRKILLLTDNKLPKEKKISAVFIHKVSSKMLINRNLFQSIQSHNNENLTLSENHISRLIKSLTTAYFKIRIYNLDKSQSYSAKGDIVRKNLVNLYCLTTSSVNK